MDKVLIVDDAPTIRSLVTHMVSQLGFEPIAFKSGPECLEAVTSLRPHVVLMDLRMNEMPGDQVCRELKKMLGSTPVVMMTIADRPNEIQACHRAGADDFLPKPIELRQLAAKLSAVTGSAPPTSQFRKVRRVLLVEPNLTAQLLIRDALEYSGYIVMTVGDMGDATAATRDSTADLLILGNGVSPINSTTLVQSAVNHGLDLVLRLNQTGAVEEGVAKVPGVRLSTLKMGDLEEVVEKANTLLHRVAVNMRQNKRRPFFSVARFRRWGTEEWSTGYTSDFSESGLCLRTLNPFETFTDVEVSLPSQIEGDPPFRGIVAWARPFQHRTSRAGAPAMGIKLHRSERTLLDRLDPSKLSF